MEERYHPAVRTKEECGNGTQKAVKELGIAKMKATKVVLGWMFAANQQCCSKCRVGKHFPENGRDRREKAEVAVQVVENGIRETAENRKRRRGGAASKV